MGTRNLTCVILDGDYVVTKYCQWDGYPSGQGAALAEFLRDDFDRALLIRNLRNVSRLTDDDIQDRWVAVGAARGANTVPWDVAKDFGVAHPQLSRDTGGAELLRYIQRTDTPELPEADPSFAADSLFCEWAYVVDLDAGTLETYRGFNEEPLSAEERFASMYKGGDYHPVRLIDVTPLSEIGSWSAEDIERAADGDDEAAQ